YREQLICSRATDCGPMGTVTDRWARSPTAWGLASVVDEPSSVASVVVRLPRHCGSFPSRSTSTVRDGAPVATKVASSTETRPPSLVARAHNPLVASSPLVRSRSPVIVHQVWKTHHEGFGVPSE